MCNCTSFHAPLLQGLWIKPQAPAPHPPESWNTPSSPWKLNSIWKRSHVTQQTWKYPTNRFKVPWAHQGIKLLALEIARDTLNLLWADVNQTQGRSKHFPWSSHRVEKLNFPEVCTNTAGRNFFGRYERFWRNFLYGLCVGGDDERAERRGLTLCRPRQRSARWLGWRPGPSRRPPTWASCPPDTHTHTHTHTHKHLLSSHHRQCRVQQLRR